MSRSAYVTLDIVGKNVKWYTSYEFLKSKFSISSGEVVLVSNTTHGVVLGMYHNHTITNSNVYAVVEFSGNVHDCFLIKDSHQNQIRSCSPRMLCHPSFWDDDLGGRPVASIIATFHADVLRNLVQPSTPDCTLQMQNPTLRRSTRKRRLRDRGIHCYYRLVYNTHLTSRHIFLMYTY